MRDRKCDAEVASLLPTCLQSFTALPGWSFPFPLVQGSRVCDAAADCVRLYDVCLPPTFTSEAQELVAGMQCYMVHGYLRSDAGQTFVHPAAVLQYVVGRASVRRAGAHFATMR
ncbi:MAG: hypothetical protein EOO65_01070 [Methanosarcinales archaeon]|nr:MAG: hypothetical protein EOO65_01070 [Methanosarcinales archaeon]